MIGRASPPSLYLRFGIQRKKAFLRDVRAAYDGLVIPANILLYQYKSTPMVVVNCEKPFFVDPMTYLLGQPYESFKRRLKKGPAFKPSFARLVEGHGFDPKELLSTPHTKLLDVLSTDSKRLESLISSTIAFQENKVRQAVDSAREYMSEERSERATPDSLKPVFTIPPYFLYDSPDSLAWRVNSSILDRCRPMASGGKDLYPMVFVERSTICTDGHWSAAADLAKSYDYPGYVLWFDDLDERFVREDEARCVISSIRTLAAGGAEVVMLFGGFFALVLQKLGVTAVSHGLAYGESRALGASASQTSGPAPVRYYLFPLHRFLTLDDSLVVLRERPDLVCDCPVCQRVMAGDPERVTAFADEEELSEMHFLYMRDRERRLIAASSVADLVKHMDWAIALNDDIEVITKRVHVGAYVKERPIVSLQYLRSWRNAIADAAEASS